MCEATCVSEWASVRKDCSVEQRWLFYPDDIHNPRSVLQEETDLH